ncbi:MAG: protein kinase [Aquabacterium sp.]|uniref:serine/threonine-protein kinase n=1 Tax=Aquabacterium sp. TaxID=1872578 RepID=UPI0025BC2596|nr:serine/threonine-protein kinase [Aquabacterium sp.]MBI5924528.1 protein kinase [Aquabacterium sp.]
MSQAESASPTPASNNSPAKTDGQSVGHSGNALPIGHRLHEFEITGLVGEGGFGIVYLAHDTQLERTVAIKEYMPGSLATRAGDLSVTVKSERQRETFTLGMRSFVNEAKLLASFDHPALIKVYRFWEENGTAYMVMPYYQGPTLKTWLREQKQAPDEAWLKGMLGPLIDALEVIHADHCYHRDIAPDNILLLGPNKPLLLDFGAARRVIGDATQALTVILKPGYAPVEQYAEVPSMKQGPWTDVYALCAVLYATIMGKAPAPSVGRMMKDDLTPISQSAAGRYSAPFLAAIDAGLTVHPEQRLQNMAALRERLFATELPPGVSAPQVVNEEDDRTVILPAGTDAATLVKEAQAHTQQLTQQGGQQATQMTAMATPHTAFPPTQVHQPAPASASSSPSAPSASGSSASSNKLWIALAALGIAGGGGAWFLTRSGQSGPAATDTGASQVSAANATPASAPASIAAASSTAAPATPPAMPAQRDPFTIVAALEDIVRSADPLMSVNTLTDKSQLVIGKDKLLFEVKSSIPGYLYVYLAGTDQNHFYLLFPNALDKNNRIEANKLVQLPRKGWHITAGGPAGVNHIVTMVSPFPRDLDKLGLNMADTIPEFDMAQAAKAWREHKGPGSPFVPPALCDGASPCEQGYGASLVHIEEVATR